jgi:hypothetical protein
MSEQPQQWDALPSGADFASPARSLLLFETLEPLR